MSGNDLPRYNASSPDNCRKDPRDTRLLEHSIHRTGAPSEEDLIRGADEYQSCGLEHFHIIDNVDRTQAGATIYIRGG